MIPFIDLQAQRRRINVGGAISRVLDHGQFIQGPEVRKLEERLAEFAGAKHCVTCASGTDALALILKTYGVGAGDDVIVPAFTFAATAEAVCMVGGRPFFCDVREDTFNIDLDMKRGFPGKHLVAVDMFGQPAEYDIFDVLTLVETDDLHSVISDGAQAFGAFHNGKRNFGDARAVSFFPSKPLGCYGDGGAILTDDTALAEKARQIATHGQDGHKYSHSRIGMNSRLDTLQAAILLEKLKVFEDEIAMRQGVADRYTRGLKDVCEVPVIEEGNTSVWAQYTIKTDKRDHVAAICRSRGIPTAIHYPKPLNQQPAYRHFPSAPTPVSDRLCKRVLSLPVHPYLDVSQQGQIIAAVKDGHRG